MAVTITLQNTVNFALPYVQFRPLAIGASNEPAITIANTVMQTILGPPFKWWFNRNQIGLLLGPGQQDYPIFMWNPNQTVGRPGWITIDSQSYTQHMALSSGTTGASPPAWNIFLDGVTQDNTVQWINQGYVGTYGSSAVGNDPIAWIEGGTIIDPNGIPHELTVKIDLQVETAQSLPLFVSHWGGYGTEDAFNIRFFTVPDQPYTVYLVYQVRARLFTSLADLWFPIPDNYSFIYQFGFLALAAAYADDPRFLQFSQMFKGHLLGASEGLDETQKNVFMERWDRTVLNSQALGLRTQQGVQGRAL